MNVYFLKFMELYHTLMVELFDFFLEILAFIRILEMIRRALGDSG